MGARWVEPVSVAVGLDMEGRMIECGRARMRDRIHVISIQAGRGDSKREVVRPNCNKYGLQVTTMFLSRRYETLPTRTGAKHHRGRFVCKLFANSVEIVEIMAQPMTFLFTGAKRRVDFINSGIHVGAVRGRSRCKCCLRRIGLTH